MGLDVYLHTAAEAAQNAAYYEASEIVHADGPDGNSRYDRMTEEERKAWSEEHTYATTANTPSLAYPDHLFNRRYLRSSYNGGGFNQAVPKMLASANAEYPKERGSLYWIFEPMGREWDGDEGALTPDDLPKLAECKARALEVAGELRKCDRLRVMSVGPNMFSSLSTTTEDQALALYRARIAEAPIGDVWWSSRDMDVYGSGVSILAAIPGQSAFGLPSVHLIYRATDAGFDSYIQAAEITAEFCDEAIALIEADGSAQIVWSG